MLASGQVVCNVPPLLTSLQDRVVATFSSSDGPIGQLHSRLDSLVTLGLWSTWSKCTAPCGGGTRKRRRSLSISGNDLGLLVDEASCNTKACPDLCNGHERLYDVNSGASGHIIVSYAAGNTVYLNNNPKPVAVLAMGQVFRATGLTAASGDYLCGSAGPLNVFSASGSRDSPWVPARLAGKQFSYYVLRFDTQAVTIRALDSPAIVRFLRGSNQIGVVPVAANEVGVFRTAFTGKTVRVESDQPVLLTYIAATPSSGGPRPEEGTHDYYSIPPAATHVRFGVERPRE